MSELLLIVVLIASPIVFLAAKLSEARAEVRLLRRERESYADREGCGWIEGEGQ